jgi:hypothetical protein
MKNSLINHFQSNTIAILFLALVFANVYWWKSPILGGFLLVGFLLIVGRRVGTYTHPEDPGMLQTVWGAWFLLSGLIIFGCIAYYVSMFSATVANVLLFTAIPAGFLIARHSRPKGWFSRLHDIWRGREHTIPKSVFITAIVTLLAIALVVTGLVEGVTLDAVRSPWHNVEPAIFVAMFMAMLGLTALLFRGRERSLTLPLTISGLFSFLAVALIVFPIGYGFDTFIHQATEGYIAEHGTITPKPLYYIGQYVLVLFSHFNFHLPVQAVDAFLLPVLTALLLPPAAYGVVAHVTGKKRLAAASLTALFFFPLASFIVTTPQGLANLWTLLLILAAVPFLLRREPPKPLSLIIPALATLLIHPIAGIPAVIFVALLLVEPRRFADRAKTLSRVAYYGAIFLGSIVLPASFGVLTLISDVSLTFDTANLSWQQIVESLHVDKLLFASNFQPVLDFAYLFDVNRLVILAALAVAGVLIARRLEIRKTFGVYGWMVGILLVNYLLLSTVVDFTFLIDYEKSNYADRLVPLMVYFLAPLILLGMAGLMQRLRRSPSLLKIGGVVLIAGWVTASFYTTYPTDDAFVTHAGFNVSQSDVTAVYSIDKEAGDKPYVVLANQSVSAAAIRELGFDNYFGDLFFYPIPTGGALYELFLEMNDTPGRTTATTAKQLAEDACRDTPECVPPETVFYVVNDYWWQSERLVEIGKQTSDDWYSLDNGAVYIFEYDF